MVLDQVAQGAGLVVVAGAGADADVLGGGDLDALHVRAVPERLEDHVREPQDQHVLDGLLAQVVVDAVDLRLVEDGEQPPVQLERGLEVRAERLLDDDPHLGVVAPVEAVLAERLADDGEERRRGGQVEEAVERDAGLVVELVHDLSELVIAVRVVEGR